MKAIHELWEEFQRVIPPDASAIQRTEMKRAFYAGASSLFHEIVSGLSDEGAEATDADLVAMDAYQGEIESWLAELATEAGAGVS